MIRVANAPCSWGVLEFDTTARHAPAAQVRDEMAAAGYTGTELGDWGFPPTVPSLLAADIESRRLAPEWDGAGYVETPHEIDALMARTDRALLGLCLDTGHLMYGGGDPLVALATYGDRIRHVHFKDCDPDVARAARAQGWDYHTAVRRGLFCELGRGMVPFAEVLDTLHQHTYSGWIVVEQDVHPGLGTPSASAARNREYLRRLGP